MSEMPVHDDGESFFDYVNRAVAQALEANAEWQALPIPDDED